MCTWSYFTHIQYSIYIYTWSHFCPYLSRGFTCFFFSTKLSVEFFAGLLWIDSWVTTWGRCFDAEPHYHLSRDLNPFHYQWIDMSTETWKTLSLLCSIFGCVAHVCFVCFVRSFVRSFVLCMARQKKNTLGDPWVHDETQKGSWGKGKLLRTLPGMVAGWTHINAARNFDTHLGKDAFVALDSCYHPWFQDHCPQQKSRLGEQCCLPQN